jgi:hypothetical protein
MAMDSFDFIFRTDLTPEQLASAKEFLALLEWKENELTRTVKREDIARIVAWYGALRYKSGFARTGSLDKPTRLIERTRPVQPPRQEETGFELEIEDLTFRPLVSEFT